MGATNMPADTQLVAANTEMSRVERTIAGNPSIAHNNSPSTTSHGTIGEGHRKDEIWTHTAAVRKHQ
jgi:hypothetical protein